MPQPFPNHLLPTVESNPATLPAERPMCCLKGMAAIAQHSVAEGLVADILIGMLNANPAPAAAIYGVIRNGKLQREAIIAAAKEVLPAGDVSLLNKIMGLLNSSAQGRDIIAHSLWGLDKKFPDDIIMIDPNELWRFSLKTRTLNARGGPQLSEAKAMQQAMRDACKVWTPQDLDDVRMRAVRAAVGLTAFSQLVQAADGSAADKHRSTIGTVLAQK